MFDEKEYDEFVEKLEIKYPAMFTNPYGGVCVGKGWWPIVESLCANIQGHLNWVNRNGTVVEQVVVMQIKEKFGGFRFYYEGGDDTVNGLVTMAESWAIRSCEECGKPGKSRSGGWIRTLCDEHEAERQARLKN